MKMFVEFQQVAKDIFESAAKENRLVRNPDNEQLRTFAQSEPGVSQTKYDNLAVVSEPMSRAAAMTKNNVDTEFGDEERKLLEQAKNSLAKEELVSIDVTMGDGTEGITARLILPKKYACLAYQWQKGGKSTMAENPTHTVIMFFDKEYENNKSKVMSQNAISIRCAHSADGKTVKIIRNSKSRVNRRKSGFPGEENRNKKSFSSPQNKVRSPLGTSKYLEWKNAEQEYQTIHRGIENGTSNTTNFHKAVTKINPLVRETAEIYLRRSEIPDSRILAEDAGQELLLKMLEDGYGQYDKSRPLAPFTRGKLKGVCRKIARKHRWQTTLAFDPIDNRSNPMEMAMRNEWKDKVSRRVREALSELPAEQKEALILVFWEGANLAAVARERGIPAGTLYVRVFRALATLSIRLKDLCWEC